ncbi:MAG TPA: hypothetical protein VG737_17800 [Cyclobacteriaceae bacterium]|nr:hypothetical protein [Cyclobacteriaceae bacterium]
MVSLRRTQILKTIILILMIAACTGPAEHKPEQCFTPETQGKIIAQAVRYSAKLAPQATHQTKFDTAFNWYYNLAAKEYDLRACRRDKDSSYFFLMTRKARSIWPAREAIGGKLRLDDNTNIADYAEEFRTWKMAEDSLNERAFELFDLMVDGKDLTPYRSKFKGDRYIEFPDDRSFWDKNEKRWRDKFLIDSLRTQ